VRVSELCEIRESPPWQMRWTTTVKVSCPSPDFIVKTRWWVPEALLTLTSAVDW
jgi:hypothetical protein